MFELFPKKNKKSFFDYDFDEIEKSFYDMIPIPKFFENIGIGNKMRTDVINNEDHYLIQAELPGFTKENINIEIKDNNLIISADYDKETEVKKENYVVKERKMNSFYRVFNIDDIKQDEIDAKYENGILEIKLPKKEVEVPPTKKINIK